MATVNEEFLDAAIRHQIGLLRLSGSIRKKILSLLDATEDEIATRIRAAKLDGTESPAQVLRIQRLLERLRNTRLSAWKEITAVWVQEMTDLALEEPKLTAGSVKTVSPVVIDTALPDPKKLRAIVSSQPFNGKTLRQWASSQARADIERIEAAVRFGLVQGEDSAAIARRVVGTKATNGRNGVTQITRNQAAAITRTAVNHVSNQARREFLKSNKAIFEQELYVATLDSRTTPICRSLDGKKFPVGRGPIPPIHFNCRSLRVGVINGKVIGSRPQRPFTEKQLVKEYADKNGITATTRDGLPRGHKGAYDDFAAKRIRELTGQVPAKVNYQTWLTRQSAAFQDDVLGETKGRLFRRGGLTLDKFVNRAGDELTLAELARKEAAAFRSAGLDPEDFL